MKWSGVLNDESWPGNPVSFFARRTRKTGNSGESCRALDWNCSIRESHAVTIDHECPIQPS